MFLQIAGVTEDLIFLTNNLMVDELNYRKYRNRTEISDKSMEILRGLDQIYIRLITGFKTYESKLA